MKPLDAPEQGLLSLDDARKWRESLRTAGKKLVVTNGCFDIMHRGHAAYLREARAQGDALLVLINSDAFTGIPTYSIRQIFYRRQLTFPNS